MSKQYIESDIREDYRRLTKLLIEKGITVTTMESCTSGLIASLITDTEGASAILPGAFVTYSNRAKIMAGVPEDTINKYSVYSTETAEAMAAACAAAYGTDIGIGVTGSMGNVDPVNAFASTPGNVYFALCIRGNVKSYFLELEPQPTRLNYKLAVAKEIYDVLIQEVAGLDE